MYHIIYGTNKENKALAKYVVLDTAIHESKKWSLKEDRVTTVMDVELAKYKDDNQTVVRGWSYRGVWHWAKKCTNCEGSGKYSWSECTVCHGWGVIEDKIP